MRMVFVIGLCVSALAAPALAEAPKPFPEFSAKRIKPPSRGSKKRITVQIEPSQTPVYAKPSEAASPNTPSASPAARYGWFWETVSPKLGDSGPGRLEPALIRLDNPPVGQGVSGPRLQSMQDIAHKYGVDILRATIGTRVSPALALAVIAVESGGQADAVSRTGAQGLMQLMPATAGKFGVTDSFDPADNIAGGVRFLDVLMARFDGDPIMVLAGYNAGETAIADHDGVPPFAETRDYVPKVLAAFQVAKGMCLTPPELVSDGCAFRLASR